MLEQKAVIETKSNISKKEQEIQELKANMDEQNRKALKEKEVLISKLEQLNIELKDREVIKEMQEEKLQVNSILLLSSFLKVASNSSMKVIKVY